MTARDRMPKKFAVVRLGGSALGAALLFLAATVVLGVPKWSVIGKVLSGNRPDVFAGVAICTALLWFIAAGFALWWLLRSFRDVRISPDLRVPDIRTSVVVLVAGVVLLGIGAVRHQPPTTVVCCGTLSEATHAGH